MAVTSARPPSTSGSLPISALGALPVTGATTDGDAVEIRTDNEVEVLARLTTWALRDKVDLIGLTVERLTLEDVYLSLTGYEGEAVSPTGGTPAHRDRVVSALPARPRRRADRDREPSRRRRPPPGGAPGLLRAAGLLAQPVAAVFTVGFSVVFLVLLAATAGNVRIPFLGHVRVVEYYVPAFAAYGVMSACFNTLTVSLVVRREMGLLKRVRLSPVPTWVMLAAIFVNALIISLFQVVVLLLIGRFGYHVALPHNLVALLVALVVGASASPPSGSP